MGKTFKRLAPILLGILALVFLILYMGGVFRTGLIGPDDARSVEHPEVGETEVRVPVRQVLLPQTHAAVGTVRARTTGQVAAQVMSRVKSVAVRSGEQVAAGQLLLELDDRELRARYQQAAEGLNAARQQQVQAERQVEAAEAVYARARTQHERIRTFFAAQAATAQALEQAEAEWRQAQAARAQAEAAVAQARARIAQAERHLEEAQVGLGYARILSPLAGQVVERRVDPGDLAMPGKILLTLQGEALLRLEALVPEGLIERLTLGQEVAVEIAGRNLPGRVEEMVPAADPAARSFLVKVGLPPGVPSLYPGMFGRLEVPLDPRPAVLAPAEAVRRVGQLEMVRILDQERVRVLLVTTGARIGADVEILSGLRGEEILLIEGAQP
ncbi:efflux RND transporter periplasmic adaptor subunit [Geoalkalibacter halelectricus]|uniref:efflux RND transporter periplasmic adaptor subunit n=1 Tax=Geoalkalibacter halelectricus TaxID=2847045 RepID=UPI003D203BA3